MSKRDYSAYLESAHWKELRRRKFAEVGPACQVCQTNDSTQCHHVNYRKLLDCSTSDLVALCEPCHKDLHLALKMHGMKSSECELYQMKSVIDSYRSTPPYVRKKTNRQRLKMRREARGPRNHTSLHRAMSAEVSRRLKAGWGSPDSIRSAISYLASRL